MDWNNVIFFLLLATIFLEPILAMFAPFYYYTYSIRFYSFPSLTLVSDAWFDNFLGQKGCDGLFSFRRISESRVAVFEQIVYRGFTYPQFLHSVILSNALGRITLIVNVNYCTIIAVAILLMPSVSLDIKIAITLAIVGSGLLQISRMIRLNRELRSSTEGGPDTVV